MRRMKKTLVALAGTFVALALLSGCANTMRAIENTDLQVSAKMSETIFLDAETLTTSPRVFVRVANTSDFQDIDFGGAIRDKMTRMGYQVVDTAADAEYQVTANVLYMGESRPELNMQSVVQSGFGGAILGASVAGVTGSNWRGAGRAGVGVGLALAATDALAGMAFKVTEYIGVVDLQIKEAVAGRVRGVETAKMTNGASTTMIVERQVENRRQEYRTRIAVGAKQTNIKRELAVDVISERLCDQICGLFRI